MQSIYETTQRFFGKRNFAEHFTRQGRETFSFRWMDATTRRYAAYAANCFHGRYVGIYAKNSARWICAFWGLLMAGFVPVLLNTAVAAEGVLHVVGEFGLTHVVVDDDYALWAGSAVCATRFDDMDACPDMLAVARWADSFAVSTSGTEGAPKSYLFNGEAMCRQILISKDVLSTAPAFSCYGRKNSIKLLAFLPFYHIFGLVTLVLWFSFFGRTLVFAADDTPQEMQRACREARVTHFFAVPIVWNTIVKRLRDEVKRQGAEARFMQAVEKSISLQKHFPRMGQWLAKNVIFKQITAELFGKTLVLGISGGAYCPAETLKIVNALGYNLLNGYGSTEAAIVSVNASPHIAERILPHCGKIFSSISYRLDAETDELLLAGGTLYYAQIIEGQVIPRGDVYVHTHDCATVSDSRELTVLGRLDEILIGPNGENLAPDVIEMHYRGIGTEDYCVMSWQSKLMLVVNRNAYAGTEAELRAAIAEANKRVPLVERVREIRLVDCPCRTPIGKANRRGLTEGFESNSIAYSSPGEADKRQSDVPAAIAVRNAMAEILHINPADIDDYDDFFANLGGCSLQYFELISQLALLYQNRISYDETLPTTVHDIVERIGESAEGADK